jgi:hypothetical protein
MAFVSDFSEEDLKRALDATGTPAVQSGPVGEPAGGGGVSGPAIPQGAAPTGTSGSEQGTGFVNLGRYFDANQGGAAEKQANALIDPLKAELPPNPSPPPGPPPTPNIIDYGGAGAQATKDYEDALSAYNKRIEDLNKARENTVGANLGRGEELANDPQKLAEAMSVNGKDPSLFDRAMVGNVMGAPLEGLRNFYSPSTYTKPKDPVTGGAGQTWELPIQAPTNPVTGGAGQSWPGSVSAAGWDPQVRKKQIGGW